MLTSNNFDHLPAKVLALTGYDFLQFIRNTLGEHEANLLNKIAVKNTLTFLATDDPLDILNYDIEDEDLEKLKDQLCFKLKNQKLLIKPGVVSGFRTLKNALQKRLNEQLTKSKRKQSQLHELFNSNSSSLSSSTTITLPAAQPATAPSSSEVPPPPQALQTKTVSKELPVSEHKEYVLRLIGKWCSENKENLNLEFFNLEENVDFTLNIDLDMDNNVTATIKCKCKKLISLGKNDTKVQVSNYYKHLQSKGCDHMNNIRKAARDSKSSQQQQQQQQTTTLDTPAPVTPTSLAPTCLSQQQTSSSQLPGFSLAATQTTSHSGSSISVTQSKENGKRRLTSQSQQQSTKRSRL